VNTQETPDRFAATNRILLGYEPGNERDSRMNVALLVSCEYATCAVPGGQRVVFEGREEELHSEAGWEPGALNLAQAFAMAFRTPIVHGEVTRLLVDLEASESKRLGKYASEISDHARERFGGPVWKGYRETLRGRIAEDLQRHDAVVHVLAHVTGAVPGHVRMRVRDTTDLAATIATSWAAAATRDNLAASMETGGIPGNLIDYLAAFFPPENYAPIRLEVAPPYFLEGRPMRWEECKKTLIQALSSTLAGLST